jgi:hypothetical protein
VSSYHGSDVSGDGDIDDDDTEGYLTDHASKALGDDDSVYDDDDEDDGEYDDDEELSRYEEEDEDAGDILLYLGWDRGLWSTRSQRGTESSSRGGREGGGSRGRGRRQYHVSASLIRPENSAVLVEGSDLARITKSGWDFVFAHTELVFARTTPDQKLQVLYMVQ